MTPKTYADLTEADLQAIADSWDGFGSFARHANVWLTDHGFAWDPEVTDEENRALFEEIAGAAWGWAR